MGTFDFLDGGIPNGAGTVQLDPETSQMIDQSGKDALKSKNQLTQESMAGTGDTNFLAGAKGPGNVAISGALQNKYEKLSGDQMQQLGAQQEYLANQRKSERLQQSQAMAMARQQVANANYARAIKAYNNQVAARAAVVSSLLGIVGAGVGMVFGGPAGAAVGAGVGKMAGDSITADGKGKASNIA